jgi:hypothetical protein
LAQGNGPGRAHAPGLLQGCFNRSLEFIVFLITIQVIFPQSEMGVKNFGHIQGGAD